MNFIKFLFTKSFLKTIGLIVTASIIVVLVVFKWLDIYTNHGENITLNDLTGLSLKQTINILKDKNLKYIVLDSSMYIENLPPKSIISQNPLPLDKVKEGRTVYLSISTDIAPLIEIPHLSGKQSKDAGIAQLLNAKFRIGDIYFRPNDAEGNILELWIDSNLVKEGDKAPEGSIIQLIVGGGLKGMKIGTPCLTGIQLSTAEFKLGAVELNIGSIHFDANVIDSSSAVIYKQRPKPYDAIRVGEAIDVFMTQELPFDIEKCETDSI